MSTHNTKEIYDYTIVGKDLTTFILQPGYVEGVEKLEKTFPDIKTMYSSIFKNTKEYCVVLWNGIPFRWSYTEDLPDLVANIIEILNQIIVNNTEQWHSELKSKTFEALWSFSTKDSMLSIKSSFIRVDGGHQNALNSLSVIKINREHFIAEWKLLIEQLLQSFLASEQIVSGSEAEECLHNIKQINNHIANRALRYQYDKR
ncbi:hypothetical protein [Aquimarina brevivitae]|uniref:Uncharacterized protein n=1 Tax=Aquimarina brevivitae TaxID=323412 RepID=A0A4Q7NYH6_9FLAO|nr:hypothetical protein [Aquimarina brevivitae]RZS92496.1 hypothetical protein EV197_2634 [Aquimarina brevivitae]